MPFYHGKSTSVLLDDADLSTYLNAIDLSADLDTAETTTFGATWKTAVAGTVGAKVDYGGFYDPAVSDLPAMLLTPASGVLSWAPAGAAAIGDRVRLAQVYETTYAESVPVGGAVAVKGAFLCDGYLGFGDVLHVLGEDTNTTTGADRDDGAASATGWIAHLHVTAVDAGSWVVKLQDAATTDWADVTGGAFTAATGATSQRLVSAAADTALRQHIRYVATRTGGTAGDGVTFFLGYARNR